MRRGARRTAVTPKFLATSTRPPHHRRVPTSRLHAGLGAVRAFAHALEARAGKQRSWTKWTGCTLASIPFTTQQRRRVACRPAGAVCEMYSLARTHLQVAACSCGGPLRCVGKRSAPAPQKAPHEMSRQHRDRRIRTDGMVTRSLVGISWRRGCCAPAAGSSALDARAGGAAQGRPGVSTAPMHPACGSGHNGCIPGTARTVDNDRAHRRSNL